jgi:hypothetical protein
MTRSNSAERSDKPFKEPAEVWLLARVWLSREEAEVCASDGEAGR